MAAQGRASAGEEQGGAEADGGGGFRYTYLRERRATDGILQAHDAHSVELENLAEFGAPDVMASCTTGATKRWTARELLPDAFGLPRTV